MTAPFWGLELVRCVSRHTAAAAAAGRAEPVRATGYRWAVSLRTREPVGYWAMACETSPATAFGPWAPGTCLAAVAPRDGWWGETRGRGAVNGPLAVRRGPAGGRGTRILVWWSRSGEG